MRWQLQTVFLVWVALAPAQRPPEVKLPDTYAANELRAWLRVFNTGDHKAIRDFRLTHYVRADATTAELDADVAMRAFERGGAYDLRSIEHSAENEIVVLLQARRNGWWATLRLETDPEYPHKITFLRAITSNRNAPRELTVKSSVR